MLYNGPYLRVLTPRTSNGVNPIMSEDGRVDYKEAHLPLTARFELEKQNKKLPDYLKKKIEVVPGHQPEQPAPVEQPKMDRELTDEEIDQQIAALLAKQAARKAPTSVKNNPSDATTGQEKPPATEQKSKPPATPNANTQKQ